MPFLECGGLTPLLDKATGEPGVKLQSCLLNKVMRKNNDQPQYGARNGTMGAGCAGVSGGKENWTTTCLCRIWKSPVFCCNLKGLSWATRSVFFEKPFKTQKPLAHELDQRLREVFENEDLGALLYIRRASSLVRRYLLFVFSITTI